MTSDNALSQFADLSPEQRQLLFEKIRQKKLNSARRPITQDDTARHNPLQLSPHQTELFRRLHATPSNRVIEIRFNGALCLSALQPVLLELQQLYPILAARLDSNENQFKPGDGPLVESIQLNQLNPADARAQLEEIRNQQQRRHCEQQALALTLVQQEQAPSHLLLSCHPLLLDSYSLLRLGHHLLAAVFTEVDAMELPTQCNQSAFAHWSSEVLNKPFLTKEWARLAPKSLTESSTTALCASSQLHLEQLDAEFIHQHLPAGQSAKQWLCDAINQCLYSWLSHQGITYWFSDPNLKDSEFENLLGYFPYYVPMQAQKREGLAFNASTELAKLHTRFSPVSEQLAHHLCHAGSPVPMVHYHWFDVDNSDQINLQGVTQLNSGVMLAPFEIHVIEQASQVDLSIHYDPDKLGSDQIQFLVKDLLALLKQDQHNDPGNRPSLPDQLRHIWRDLLQVTEIPPAASFFELGGHSLQVTEMKFRIKQQLKLDIPISVLYELPTIEKLSSFILATHGNSLGWTPDSQHGDQEEEEGTL
ncbi:acyl carrier protein [Ketobacter sp.]|uniref:acyl carrier protein n=1 Tax=Ketobacter sp. TaxID=2083498 RepID=UPI000F2663C3|nr:acyl carrier protein [Ketobacter sp.]RLT92103.1 MAG: acyl carrier protein [Ketobacter sp.]